MKIQPVLMVKDFHCGKEIQAVHTITRDGWVMSKTRGFGDNIVNCEIYPVFDLKALRKQSDMSQKEMAWVMGVSRPTYVNLERTNGKGLKLSAFLALTKCELFKKKITI